MKKRYKLLSLLAGAVASLGLIAPANAFFTPRAQTLDVADVRPGMSIATNDGPLKPSIPGNGTWCTVTAVGRDDTGRLLGLAAGHCIPPDHNLDVKAAGIDGVGPVIGHWVTPPTGFPGIYQTTTPDLSHDGAFFEILPGLTVSNQLPNGTRINALGNPPAWLQHHCKFGQVTGETCGFVTKTGSPFESTAGVIQGDSGGPAYAVPGPNAPSGKLIGITSANNPNRFSAIQNILLDAAGQGVNGFVPLP